MLLGAKKNKSGNKPDLTDKTNFKSIHEDFEDTNISDFLFNPNEILPEERILISIQGKKILTVGNTAVIAGKPKSRKSVVVHSIIASILSNKNILGIDAELQKNERVILIDTEQNKQDLKKSLLRVAMLAELDFLDEKKFLCYTTRQLDPERTLLLIEKLASDNKNRLILVDGALDLINNMNDVVEVKAIIQRVKTVLEKNNCALVFVIHLSKSTNFTIGHFGSFFDRFSQSVLEITRLENGNSEVKAQNMRSDDHFEAFEFYWNYNINNYSLSWTDTNTTFYKNYRNYSDEEHEQLLKKCFSSNEFLQEKQLINMIAKTYKKTEPTAKKIIEYLTTEIKLLEKENKGYKIIEPVVF